METTWKSVQKAVFLYGNGIRTKKCYFFPLQFSYRRVLRVEWKVLSLEGSYLPRLGTVRMGPLQEHIAAHLAQLMRPQLRIVQTPEGKGLE